MESMPEQNAAFGEAAGKSFDGNSYVDISDNNSRESPASPSLFDWIMGTDYDPQHYTTVTNPFFPDPTAETPDRIQGWLSKKVKQQDTQSTEPKKRETKEIYRWFVYNKKERMLEYYRKPADAEESANKVLSVQIIHKIEMESTNTLLIHTLLHEFPATKCRKFRVTASSAAEARLWQQGLETARLEWLLQAGQLVMTIQKRFRQRQARKHAEKVRKMRGRQWKSNNSFIFSIIFLFLAVSMSFFRSDTGIEFARSTMGMDISEAVAPATDWVLGSTNTTLNKMRPGLGTQVVHFLQDPVITVHVRKPSFNVSSLHDFGTSIYALSLDSLDGAYNATSTVLQATATAASNAMNTTSGWAQSTSVWAGSAAKVTLKGTNDWAGSATLNFSRWVDSVSVQGGKFVGSFMKGPHGYAAEKIRPRARSDAVIAAENLRSHYEAFKLEQQDHSQLRFEKSMQTFKSAKGKKSESDPRNQFHMFVKFLSTKSGVDVMQCLLSIQTEDKLICPNKAEMGRCKIMQVLLEELEAAIIAEFKVEHAHSLTEKKVTNEQAGFIIVNGWW